MGEKGFRGRDGRLHEKGEKDSKAEEKFMRCQPSAYSPSHTLSSKSTKTHNLNCLSSSLILRVRMREVFEAPMFSLPSAAWVSGESGNTGLVLPQEKYWFMPHL